MGLTPLLAMVRKDLQVHYTDRRAVIMGFVAPIAIASFLGSLFGGSGGPREPAKIPIAIVDQDGSVISKGIVASASADRILNVTSPTADEARASVRHGDVTVAVVIPAGFGEASGLAFFGGGERPPVVVLYDPSHAAEMALVRGMLTQHVMEVVSREMFSGSAGRQMVERTLRNLDGANIPDDQRALLRTIMMAAQGLSSRPGASGDPASAPRGISLPYTVNEEAITGQNVAYNGYAHSFAGMGVQALLFAMIDLGVGVLLERQRGLWKRLRSAPISRLSLLVSKTLSGSAIALSTLLVSFLFAGVVFGVRIHGSIAGFVIVCIAAAFMAATFGLLIASLGHTPGGSRGVASLAVLLMVMLGGAWMPTFVFPAWVQRLTVVVPTRWAIDGMDAMTWRGLGFSEVIVPVIALIGFGVLFGTLALARFRWEEA